MKRTRPAGLDGAFLRPQFPALGRLIEGKRLVYLDSACTALKPRAVIDAVADFHESLGSCGGKRSTHLLAQLVEQQANQARQTVAEFMGAESANEIVFTSGATEAANLLARAFPYESGRDEVVLSDLEHNAVFLPFFEATRRGEARLKLWRGRDGVLDPDDLKKLVSDRTALVAVTHASNVCGGVQALAEICRIAHRHGARVFSDDAQFVCTHRENVSAMDIDFAAFSAHKIGGPFGLGVLYGKEHELNRLRHYKVGGGTVRSVSWTGESPPEVRYLDAPARFEAGVANFGAFAGLTAAIGLLRSIPEAALRAHISGLVGRTVKGLARLPQIRVVGDVERLAQGSLVSFYPVHPDFSIVDLGLFLNHELSSRCVALRVGEHCAHLLHQSLGIPATARASFWLYNTAAEVDCLIEAVGEYARTACP